MCRAGGQASRGHKDKVRQLITRLVALFGNYGKMVQKVYIRMMIKNGSMRGLSAV